ncbi:MAG: hypothetical protein Q7T92_11695 [Lutibacter sp.]|nr:hypothetical protein [Lutibacter sp.]
MLIKEKHSGSSLPNSDKFTDRLLRLPMYFELDVQKVTKALGQFIK